MSAAEDRYLMTVIATAENPQFSVSRIDIDRTGPTYTVDTLAQPAGDTSRRRLLLHHRRRRPRADPLLAGRRRNSSRSPTSSDATRPGHTLTDAGLPAGGVSLVEVPALAISSTDCRLRVAKGEPVWYLVPDGVVRYIDKRALYVDAG